MLLAAAGQAAPYTYDSSATRKIGNNNNNNSNNNNVNNVSGGTSTPTTATGSGTIGARPTTASSIASTAACAIMKTLSVRLHRGTEFIKDTVQKALVMSATTPGQAGQQIQPPEQSSSHSLKRKFTGTGGIMGASSGMDSNLVPDRGRSFVVTQPYVEPTAAFLRHFTVAPTELHRSASARKRNPSTDSLLMDLCLFKPIRPMPITPIKINKARGFELKRPKFMPPAANVYSDADDDDDDEEEEELEEPEVARKPKLSTLTLPQHATASAFVPHEANTLKSNTQVHAKDNSNTHTSDPGAVAGTAETAKPKAAAATKRRRRAPLLTAKRRRKTTTKAKEAAPPPAPAPPPVPASAVALKRKRRNAAGSATEPTTAGSSTIISPMRHSPPMTRQRARLQISASNN